MGEVLSQSEIDNLLKALSSGELDVDEMKNTEEKQVKNYDFARPSKFSKEHLRTLEIIYEHCGRLLSTNLPAYLRKTVNVEVVNSEVVIYSEFSNEFSLANVKRQEDTPCKHEIWVCIGAFYEEYNPVGGRSYLKLHNNLEQDNFAYNGYVCIECGRTVYTKKWQEFESKHFVLKNLYDEKTYQYYMENNSCYYRDLYYQLLFTNPVEVAQQKVISEFNKNMEKTKVLKKES